MQSLLDASPRQALFRIALGLLLGSCGGGGGGGGANLCPGSCLDLSGTHALTGDCAARQCTITQTDCNIQVSCDDGTMGSGSASSGISFSSADVSCSGQFQNGALAGSCRNTDGTTCNFQVTESLLCQDGSTPGTVTMTAGSGAAGMAGMDGTAGSTAGKSGGTDLCLSCAEAFGPTDIGLDALCSDSQAPYTALRNCVCSGACASACTTYCTTDADDATCDACAKSSCVTEVNTCQMH